MTASAHVERFTLVCEGGPIVGHVYGRIRGRAPAVIMCTGFGGTQDTPAIVAAAETFAGAGIRAITFDYRQFGLSGGAPRQVVSVRQQLDDIRTVVRDVRAMPGVDPGRIALWGSSLGGGHAITVAAEDPRIAAVVAQVPFNGFPRRVEGRSSRDTLALLRAAVGDAVRGWLRRAPRYVKAVGAPTELAVMASNEASALVASLDSPTWLNQVAPRGLLDMMRYRPGRTVDRIAAPLLVCVAARDAETHAASTDPLARDAQNGLQLSYDVTHFEIYRPDVRERVLRDQVAFLRKVLLAAGRQGPTSGRSA